MGKFTSPFGRFQGKIGNIIFRANGTETVALASPLKYANPKTPAQIRVRSRMLPASRTYQRLVEILDHSFAEKVLLSRNDFMKYALVENYYPYLAKKSVEVVPGAYKLTNGVLPTITASVDDNQIFTNLYLPTAGSVTGANLIANNPGRIEDGDQLTYIVVGYNYDGDVMWYYNRFRIDNDNEAIPYLVTTSSGSGQSVNIAPFAGLSQNASLQIIAAACIRTTILNDSYTYSEESFVLNMPDYINSWMSDNAFNAMLASYGVKTANTIKSSTKYLQRLVGTQPSSNIMPAPSELNPMTITLTSGEEVEVYVIAMADGNYMLVQSSQDGNAFYAVDPQGNPITINGQANTRVFWANVSASSKALLKGYWLSGSDTTSENPSPAPEQARGFYVVTDPNLTPNEPQHFSVYTANGLEVTTDDIQSATIFNLESINNGMSKIMHNGEQCYVEIEGQQYNLYAAYNGLVTTSSEDTSGLNYGLWFNINDGNLNIGGVGEGNTQMIIFIVL